jgi:hypothetical protein
LSQVGKPCSLPLQRRVIAWASPCLLHPARSDLEAFGEWSPGESLSPIDYHTTGEEFGPIRLEYDEKPGHLQASNQVTSEKELGDVPDDMKDRYLPQRSGSPAHAARRPPPAAETIVSGESTPDDITVRDGSIRHRAASTRWGVCGVPHREFTSLCGIGDSLTALRIGGRSIANPGG